MTRFALASLASLAFLAPVRGQDMPLSEIIIPGEGWVPIKVERAVATPDHSIGSKRKGFGYSTQPGEKAVFLSAGPGEPKRLDVPLEKPTGLALIHNDSTLVVADAASKYLWAFRVKADGTLDARDRYYSLRVRKNNPVAETTVLTTDTKDRVYAATSEGIQIFDPTGRLCGVLMLPVNEPITKMSFGGEKADQLQILTATKGFTRKMIANEVISPKKK
jgi:gluconolactonase